jgi:hypothetical protein
MQNWRVILFPRQRLFLNNYLTTYWNKLVIFNVSTLLTVTYIAVLLLEPEDAIGIDPHRQGHRLILPLKRKENYCQVF